VDSPARSGSLAAGLEPSRGEKRQACFFLLQVFLRAFLVWLACLVPGLYEVTQYTLSLLNQSLSLILAEQQRGALFARLRVE